METEAALGNSMHETVVDVGSGGKGAATSSGPTHAAHQVYVVYRTLQCVCTGDLQWCCTTRHRTTSFPLTPYIPRIMLFVYYRQVE